MNGKRVLITGAAGGIGACLADECAKAGAILILTDIHGPRLKAAAAKLRASGAVVHTRLMDASSPEAVQSLARWVGRKFGGLDILVNNAGVGHIGELADTKVEDWKRLIDVNLWGPLHHTYAFLPSMIQRRQGRIVNVSSGQAFFRLPTWGAYAAIKLALGAFSEILSVEVRKYGIQVLTVYPFMVNTGFYESVRPDTWGGRLSMKLRPYYSMSPESVARIVFKAIQSGKSVERVSVLNEFARFTQCLPLVSGVVSRAANYLLAKKA